MTRLQTRNPRGRRSSFAFWRAVASGFSIAIFAVVAGSAGPVFAQAAISASGSGAVGSGNVQMAAAPPAGFDAVAASDQALAAFGYPPRPHQNAAALREWKRAVRVPRTPGSPALEATTTYHGPVVIAGAQKNLRVPSNGADSNATQIQSGNWSGWAINDGARPFSLEAIQAVWNIPTARVAFYACPGYTFSSQWPGIDGFASSDVLQAGTDADAYNDCILSFEGYTFWFEWFPFPETRIGSPFTANGGDLVFVQVWNTSSTVGHAYFADISTDQAFSVQFSAPGGTTLQGNSVEWIVERPAVGGGLATLMNYINIWMFSDYAYNYTSSSPTFYLPGFNPTGTAYQIEMLDNSNNGISYGFLQNFAILLFEDFGSAL